jgi:sarcosine oxidase gamma subunit
MYTYNMIRTQIYLPQQQHDHLKALALKKRTSMSSVVRQLIDEKIGPNVQAGNINEKIGPGQWLLNQAKQAEKMGFQGPSDLASKVDEYLYG